MISPQIPQAADFESNYCYYPKNFQSHYSGSCVSVLEPVMESDTMSVISDPISETHTCFSPESQDTRYISYQNCITSHQLGLSSRLRGENSNQYMTESPNEELYFSDFESDHDDDRTIIFEQEKDSLMQVSVEKYNSIRTLVFAKEANAMYVFQDKSSFDSFRSKKSSRKAFGIIGSSGKIEKLSVFESTSEGVPLLKVEVPSISLISRDTPFMIFRKPSSYMEAHEFCTVRLKYFYYFKKYIFDFKTNGETFRIFAFQNNFRSYTDFNYAGTRFRVLGTSKYIAYPTHYDPELKLCILDDEQPSLAERFVKKRRNASSSKMINSKEPQNFRDLEDRVPSPSHPLIRQIIDNEGYSYYRDNVPQNHPPFGKFLDSWAVSRDSSAFSRQVTEIGKFAVFEDDSELIETPIGCSVPVHANTLVLTTIMMALRETCARTMIRKDNFRENVRNCKFFSG